MSDDSGAMVIAQRQPLFLRLFVIEPDGFGEHLTEIEGDVFQDQAAGFDFREIQRCR